MVHLSGVVGGISGVVVLFALAFRRTLPVASLCCLWHAAGAGFIVSLAASERFARRSQWVLGKSASGTISTAGLVAFWPYHVGLRAKLAIQRRISSEPAYTKITPLYYIGGWPSEEELCPTVSPAILDVTCELPLQVRPPAYKVLKVWDTHSPDVGQIEEGVRWAREQAARGRPVLVHCAHGHGRSATVLGAILIAEGLARGVEEAEAVMKAERPKVRLNRRQRAALKAWAFARGKAE